MKHVTKGSVYARVSQGGEGLQSVEGSGSDRGQLVVVQRQQTDVVQPCETVVVDTADLVVPQHPEEERNETLPSKNQFKMNKTAERVIVCVFVRHSQHTQSFKPTEHPASDRVDLIGCEVKLNDGCCTFECPVFNLCDLVVAEVTVRGRKPCQKSKHSGI